jgi:hypothetical protein
MDLRDDTKVCPGCGSSLDRPFAVIPPRERRVPVVRRLPKGSLKILAAS